MNLLIAILIAAALGGSSAWKLTTMHYEHLADVAAQKARAAVDTANQRADNAASDWEVWASLQRPKNITVTREVEREITADVDCSARPLPDGLRRALTAAGTDPDQPIPDRAMPAASAARAADLR